MAANVQVEGPFETDENSGAPIARPALHPCPGQGQVHWRLLGVSTECHIQVTLLPERLSGFWSSSIFEAWQCGWQESMKCPRDFLLWSSSFCSTLRFLIVGGIIFSGGWNYLQWKKGLYRTYRPDDQVSAFSIGSSFPKLDFEGKSPAVHLLTGCTDFGRLFDGPSFGPFSR